MVRCSLIVNQLAHLINDTVPNQLKMTSTKLSVWLDKPFLKLYITLQIIKLLRRIITKQAQLVKISKLCFINSNKAEATQIAFQISYASVYFLYSNLFHYFVKR